MFGERLKSARLMAGMSLEQLAQKIGNLTKQAISNYEKGKREPDSSVIISLANALSVRPEYFFQKQNINLGEFEYRKKSVLRIKEKNKIEEKAKDIISKYREIESLLGVDHVWNNPLEDFQINDEGDIEEAAEKLRSKWDLGSNAISNLMETVEDNGIKLVYIDADKRFDGLANFAGAIPVVLLNENIKDFSRLRLTLAHELGHLMLKFSSKYSSKEKEQLCFRFGGAFLIPEEQVIKEFGSKHRRKFVISELTSLKEEYGISIQALAKRMNQLEIISDALYRRFNIQINRYGMRYNEPGIYNAESKPKRFRNLVHRAVAEEIISVGKAASLMNTTIDKFEMDLKLVV